MVVGVISAPIAVMTQIGCPGSRALLAFVGAVPRAVEGRGGGSAGGHAIACLCSSRNGHQRPRKRLIPMIVLSMALSLPWVDLDLRKIATFG